jgi:methionine-rich copper-binding protein CopC
MRQVYRLQRLALCAPIAVLLLAAAPAVSDTMHLLSTEPRANQVMSGEGVAFALHFDHPIDHEGSRFMLVTPDGQQRTIPVRLGAQPSVLYGSVGRLAPGRYVLNWSARASDGAASSGTLQFEVAAPR